MSGNLGGARSIDLTAVGSPPLRAALCADDETHDQVADSLVEGLDDEIVGSGVASPDLDDDAVRRLIQRGHVVLTQRQALRGPDLDVGPRAVTGLPWVRVVRTPLGVHTRGSVNAFLVDTDDGLIVIDTGLSSESDRLLRALRVAGHQPGDVFLATSTHCHADHVGGLAALQRAGWLAPDGRVALYEGTDELGRDTFLRCTPSFRDQLTANGVGDDDVAHFQADIDLMGDLADWPQDVQLLQDGDHLAFGAVSLEVVHTPGHSPDHVVFHARHRDGSEVVFLGDMTLGDGMPRCGVRDWLRPDPVGDLLASWNEVVRRVHGPGLPAHGRPVTDLAALHDRIVAAYDDQVAAVQCRLADGPASAADLMCELVGPEDGFGPRQFAFYDSLAMLRHLVSLGRARLIGRQPDRYGAAETTR